MRALAIIVPVLGRDRALLPDLIASIVAQDCLPTELIISTDDPDLLFGGGELSFALRLLHNPGGAIARSLNLAIQSTTCEYVLRFDVRARPTPDYIHLCLTALDSGADVAGGRLLIAPGDDSRIASAIALAASHPLGAGDARYRVGGQWGEVDTVPYPCFRKTLWERIGGYNESLGANEDYEFNWRVRQAGGRVVFDPSIKCGYLARASFHELAGQYFRYGWWKAQMLRQHPQSIRWRQLLPIAASVMLVLSVLLLLLWPSLLWLSLSLIAAYCAMLAAAGIRASISRRSIFLLPALPAAFFIIHVAWSSGVWVNFLTGGRWPFRR